jgi:hypothetical protein
MSTYVLLVSCTALLLVLATRHGEPAQTLRRASGSPQPIIFSSSMPQRKKRGKNPKHTFPSRPRHSLAPLPKPPVPSLSPACFLCALSRSQLFASVSVHKRVHTSHSLLSSPLHFATEPLPEAAIVAPEPRERLFAFSTYGASSSRLLGPGAARQRQCWRSCCSCTSSCSSLLLTRTAASTGAGGRCTSRSSRWRARPRPSSRSYPTARHRPRRRRRRRLATPPPPPPPAPATRRTLRRQPTFRPWPRCRRSRTPRRYAPSSPTTASSSCSSWSLPSPRPCSPPRSCTSLLAAPSTRTRRSLQCIQSRTPLRGPTSRSTMATSVAGARRPPSLAPARRSSGRCRPSHGSFRSHG